MVTQNMVTGEISEFIPVQRLDFDAALEFDKALYNLKDDEVIIAGPEATVKELAQANLDRIRKERQKRDRRHGG